MCPEPQLLSIYLDGELPSPWKEKMENHLTECSSCREKLENFRQLQGLFKKDTSQQSETADSAVMEQELMEASKEKVWKRLESRQRFRPVNRQSTNIWQRRFSVPLPAAAAAAVIIALATALWLSVGTVENNSFAAIPQIETMDRTSFIIAAEEEMSGLMPAADISSVLQYLGGGDTNIIILQLPENKNFFRAGEPVVRAADYTRR